MERKGAGGPEKETAEKTGEPEEGEGGGGGGGEMGGRGGFVEKKQDTERCSAVTRGGLSYITT